MASGRYVACSKHGSANIEIINESPNHVMVGLTVALGSSSLERVPTSITVFGREMPIANISRARVFDFAFSREESLTADRRVRAGAAVAVSQEGALAEAVEPQVSKARDGGLRKLQRGAALHRKGKRGRRLDGVDFIGKTIE